MARRYRKTALLKTLYTNEDQNAYGITQGASFHSVFISLDAYDFANPVNILMAVRNGIVGDCGLFDYAMLQYCSKAKLNVEEIMQKNSMISSPFVDVLNELISLGTASACIPASTIIKCVDLIKDKKLKIKFSDEIKEIETLNEFEIFERLPYYLGLCISNAAKKNHYHVLFLDSYESLLARTEFGTFSVDREEWLKELFLSSEYIRIFIASRDRLRWDQDDPVWNDYLQQHLLANLSDDDSRWFLHQVPISDENVVEMITKNSNGVPLYGSESYYDKESDCYIWYNTDVSPNLWQYWYEGVSNRYESGWMEYEGINNWYIEDKSGDWDIYSGDTSNFWHILCPFDDQ